MKIIGFTLIVIGFLILFNLNSFFGVIPLQIGFILGLDD